jgi:nucleoside-diphosphate-sugar epimerase
MRLVHLAVTGANGFVGRHVVRHGVESGSTIRGIVRSADAARVVSEAGGQPVELTRPDIDSLAQAFAGAEAVVHLAQIGAESGEATYDRVNIGLTETVTEACRRADVARIVFFSGLGVARYGTKRRCTNPYFLSKLEAEMVLFRSDREPVVFRPSYIVGPGDTLLERVLDSMRSGEVDCPGDGAYRLQPIAVADAAALALAAASRPPGGFPRVFDLVGPEPVSYARLLERLARAAPSLGRKLRFHVREVPLDELDRQAAAGGYQGMLPDELDCLLCDEVSDPAPLVALLGRPLTPLDAALEAALRAS